MDRIKQAETTSEYQLRMLAAKQTPLTDFIEAGLKKQFNSLLKRLDYTDDSDVICNITDRLIRLAYILDPALRQNQSFFGENANHPYVLQIPAQDLLALYAARATANYSANYDTRTSAGLEEYIRRNQP